MTGADGGKSTVQITVTLPAPTNLRLRGTPAPQRVDLVWDYPNMAFTYKQATTPGLVPDARAWTRTQDPASAVVDRTVYLVGDSSTRFDTSGGAAPELIWDDTSTGEQVPFPLWLRFYTRVDALPTGGAVTLAFASTGSKKVALQVGTDGLLAIATSDGVTSGTTPTDIRVATGKWIRIEASFAESGDDQVQLRITDGDDPHAAATKQWSGEVGMSLATAWPSFSFGAVGATDQVVVQYWQDLWEVSTLGWIGPYAVSRRAATQRAAAGPVNFRVYRAGDGTPEGDLTDFQLIGTVTEPWVRTYTDTSLTPGGPYAYRVTAVLDGQESAPSNVVTIDTTIPAPVLREWQASRGGQAFLAWDVQASEWRWHNDTSAVQSGRRPFDLIETAAGGLVQKIAEPTIAGPTSTMFQLPPEQSGDALAREWWNAKVAGQPRAPVAFRFYGYLDQLPPTDPQIIFGIEGSTAGTSQVQVQIDSAGTLWAFASGGSWQQAPSLVVRPGAWWRLEVGIGLDGPDVVTLRLTQGADPHAVTYTQAQVDAGVDLTALAPTRAWFGLAPKGAGAFQMYQDLWAGTTQGWCGPYPGIEESGSSGTLPDSYTLQRKDSASGGDFADVASITDPWQTTYTDTGLTEGVTYTYRLNAVYGTPGTATAWSNEVAIVAAGAAPEITSITPNVGLMDGGTQVTVKGINFTGATKVTFCGNEGTALTVVDDSTIVVTSPAGSGPVACDVVVTTPGGSATKANGYAYQVKDLAQLATLGDTLNDFTTVADTLEGLHEGTPET